jgi:hypothetical protein
MMMAPVQLWNPTELPQLLLLLLLRRRRRRRQPETALKLRNASVANSEMLMMRESVGVLSFHKFHGQNFFPVHKRINNFRECCFSFLLSCCNYKLSKLRNLYSSRSFRAPYFEPKTY